MKRVIPILIVLLAVVARPALAASGGIGLRWGACEGPSNRNFACDSNNGTEMLVVSFQPPPGVTKLTGVEIYGRVFAADNAVPAWWQLMERGGCRFGGLAASFELSDLSDGEDTWQGQAMGGVIADGRPVEGGKGGMKFVVAVAVPGTMAQGASSGRTYAAAKLLVNHKRSTGPGSCTGCSTPACVVIDKIVLGQPNERGYKNYEITSGMLGLGGAGNVATWQGGTPECGAGASKPTSWSKLKERFK